MAPSSLSTDWEMRIKAIGVTPVMEHPHPHLTEEDDEGAGERFDLTAETGSLMYMSPEVFKGENYNEKADVFSFGVILYEVRGRRGGGGVGGDEELGAGGHGLRCCRCTCGAFGSLTPQPLTRAPSDPSPDPPRPQVMHRYMMMSAICVKGVVAELEAYASKVAKGYRPPIDAKFPEELRKLIDDCWAQDPEARPSMQQVVERMQDIQELGVLSTYEGGGPGCCVIC